MSPCPPSPCAQDLEKPNALNVFIGGRVATGSHFPMAVLQVNFRDRITIDRDSAGKLALSADILDGDGKVIVTF